MISETKLNMNSSRSHCIYKLVLKFYYKFINMIKETEVSISLVDLAGSENAKKTEN